MINDMNSFYLNINLIHSVVKQKKNIFAMTILFF